MYFFIFIRLRIDIRLANSEDPDKTPPSAASDLGLHSLSMSQKWDARLIWVNISASILGHYVENIIRSFFRFI